MTIINNHEDFCQIAPVEKNISKVVEASREERRILNAEIAAFNTRVEKTKLEQKKIAEHIRDLGARLDEDYNEIQGMRKQLADLMANRDEREKRFSEDISTMAANTDEEL